MQQRHWLRWQAWLTGVFSLAAMAALSAILLHAGMDSMGLRYGLVLAAGPLLWPMFGSERFLAVAVEVAFGLRMARTLYVMEREGGLLVAPRLSWKPVLGALRGHGGLGRRGARGKL